MGTKIPLDGSENASIKDNKDHYSLDRRLQDGENF